MAPGYESGMLYMQSRLIGETVLSIKVERPHRFRLLFAYQTPESPVGERAHGLR